MNNVEVFEDTQKTISTNRTLMHATENAISNTRVINEGFVSEKKPHFSNCSVSFEENLTLRAAFRYVDAGKRTAVLNFANPVEPGGGVLRGANAQEEYLCRASNLYNCLNSENAKAYYSYHNDILKRNQYRSIFLASDKIVYSQDVTAIKKDKNYLPQVEGMIAAQVYTEKWRKLDVISCAAPFFSGSGYMLPDGDLYHLFRRRIRNILESAIENDIESLILGAFGCGAFHNPPAVVANAFQDTLLEDRYRNAFSDVVFAVKRSGSFCENIEAFEIAFSVFPPTGEYVLSSERNKRRFFEF